MLSLMIALAGQLVPPPPIVGDYFPGPWFWPVEQRGDRLVVDFDFAQVRRATERGTIRVVLCVERDRAGPNDRKDRVLLAQARDRLRRGGVTAVSLAQKRCAPPSPPREVAGVMLMPQPR